LKDIEVKWITGGSFFEVVVIVGQKNSAANFAELNVATIALPFASNLILIFSCLCAVVVSSFFLNLKF